MKTLRIMIGSNKFEQMISPLVSLATAVALSRLPWLPTVRINLASYNLLKQFQLTCLSSWWFVRSVNAHLGCQVSQFDKYKHIVDSDHCGW